MTLCIKQGKSVIRALPPIYLTYYASYGADAYACPIELYVTV
jgi:hypothetical protein